MGGLDSLTPLYTWVAFGGLTLTALTFLLLRRTYLVLSGQKKANEMGASSVVKLNTGGGGGEREYVNLGGGEGNATGSGSADDDSSSLSIWKRLERVHGNAYENCMYICRVLFFFSSRPLFLSARSLSLLLSLLSDWLPAC